MDFMGGNSYNFAPKKPRKLIILHGLLKMFLDLFGGQETTFEWVVESISPNSLSNKKYLECGLKWTLLEYWIQMWM